MRAGQRAEKLETIVIGGGQAGLAVGYHLAKRGLPFRILEANQRIGDSWRNRWDTLRLFTPARYNGLPGMAFPGSPGAFPTNDETADYLEAYAAHFELPIELGVRVDRLAKEGDGFSLSAGDRRYEADNVVVAMATFQVPSVPPLARELDRGIVQMHSSEYRNPSQLQDGGVLVVGAGNSGAEIGLEAAKQHPTWVSGREVGHVPFRIETPLGRNLLVPFVLRILYHRVMTVDTPIGRKMRAQVLSHGGLLVRVKPDDLTAAGVQRVPRTVGVRDGQPVVGQDRVLEVANVIWSTGYRPGFSWIDLPIFPTENGCRRPRHVRGIVPEMPGSILSACSSCMPCRRACSAA